MESGRPVALKDKSFVEGSIDHGGIQPHYFVNLAEPETAALLKAARALRTAKPTTAEKWQLIGKIKKSSIDPYPMGVTTLPNI